MGANHIRTRKSIAPTALVATATCVAALTWAGPASAERKTVVYEPVISHCRGADDCDVVQVPFEVETGSQTVLLSNVPNRPGNDCAKAVAEFSLDGQRLQSRFVGPDWEQPPFTMNAAPGKHALDVRILTQSDCKTGAAGDYAAARSTRRQKQDALIGISARACARSSRCLIRAASAFSPRRTRHSCSPWSDQRLSGCWQARLNLPSRPRSER